MVNVPNLRNRVCKRYSITGKERALAMDLINIVYLVCNRENLSIADTRLNYGRQKDLPKFMYTYMWTLWTDGRTQLLILLPCTE